MFNFVASIIIGLVSLSSVSGAMVDTSTCVCTTVQCPIIGINTLVMGGGI